MSNTYQLQTIVITSHEEVTDAGDVTLVVEKKCLPTYQHAQAYAIDRREEIVAEVGHEPHLHLYSTPFSPN